MPDSTGRSTVQPAATVSPAATTPVRHWLLPLVVATTAWLAVIGTLDSSGAVPQLGEGPGLTLDETFNVQMGVYHIRAAREYGVGLLSFESMQEIFGADVYNPDHPPLGRVFIGLAHELSRPLLTPDVLPSSVAVTCGRVASACGFALTIFLVGWTTSRWYGRTAGLIAAVSLLLMPRMFAHGHLASLETFIGLFYTATVLYTADHWDDAHKPAWRAVLVSGVLLGLALLTKIQAILLPIPIAIWAVWYWRWRAILPVLLFGSIGVLLFFVGWPWLWLDPVAHLGEYFGRTTERLTLYCWYMGQKWADTDVPWHYPLVMFVVTVPAGLHALGLWGLLGDRVSGFVLRRSEHLRRSDKADDADRNPKTESPAPTSDKLSRVHSLIALNVFWPLAFFALPGITVYDGTRLFLMVFPLWAVLIGRGGQLLWDVLAVGWNLRFATPIMAAFLAAQSYGVVAMHPVQLSYYNLLAGGLRGASRLGFETTYWGDSVTRSLLQRIGPEVATGPLFMAPVLHPFQLRELQRQAPNLHTPLVPFDEHRDDDVRRLLVFRRRADSWPSLTPAPPHSRLRAEVSREGVQLSGFYEIAPGAFGQSPTSDSGF